MTHQYTYRLFIDGQWTNGTGHDELKVVNPATEEVIGMVPDGTVADAHAAILAARKAFDEGPWGKSSPRDRAVVLSRMATSSSGGSTNSSSSTSPRRVRPGTSPTHCRSVHRWKRSATSRTVSCRSINSINR
jgi:hypothetical protein